MRLRKIKDANIKMKQFSEFIVLEPNLHQGKWKEVFKNENKIFLEIGMGKGQFIRQNANQESNINFIGCEVSESIMLRALRKHHKELKNIKYINCDALDLDKVFMHQEISKIYLNFSDPWPKNRHEKRRLTSKIYLDIYRLILTENGEIELKTDNRVFFEYCLVQFNNYNFKFLDVILDLHKDGDKDILTTEYEDKYKEKGNKIYYLKVKK